MDNPPPTPRFAPVSSTRKRILGLLAWLALVGASIRPIGPLESALSVAVSPLRVVAELASPFWLLRGPEVRAAEGRLLSGWEEEARAGAELNAALAREATPADPTLVQGRRLVHAEAIGRSPNSRDRLRIRVHDARGLDRGYPVVNGSAYVGRVLRVDPFPDPASGGEAWVELVTAPSFHVGVRVLDEEHGLPIDMTVGGIDGEAGVEGVALAVHRPSDRSLVGGEAVVHERLDMKDHANLAEGYGLGRLRRVGEERWVVEPLLDYLDGLFHVVVLAPEGDGSLPSDEPLPQALADEGWRRARPLSHGDPTPWRESVRLAVGGLHGVRPGAALAFGARMVGRVAEAGPWTSTATLFGDAGWSVVAVALFEGDGRPRVLGRLVSLGRDADGVVRWVAAGGEPLSLEPDGEDGCRTARLFTGAGDAGVPSGLFLGRARVPVGAEERGRRVVRLTDAVDAGRLEGLWVRVEGGPSRAGGRP